MFGIFIKCVYNKIIKLLYGVFLCKTSPRQQLQLSLGHGEGVGVWLVLLASSNVKVFEDLQASFLEGPQIWVCLSLI